MNTLEDNQRLLDQKATLNDLKRKQSAGEIPMMKGNTEEEGSKDYEFPEIEKGFYHIHVVNKQASRDGKSIENVLDAVLKDTPAQFKAKNQRGAYAFDQVRILFDPIKNQEEEAARIAEEERLAKEEKEMKAKEEAEKLAKEKAESDSKDKDDPKKKTKTKSE